MNIIIFMHLCPIFHEVFLIFNKGLLVYKPCFVFVVIMKLKTAVKFELSEKHTKFEKIFLMVWTFTKSRTATGMDGTLTLIFRKSETSRDIIKSF